MNPWYNRIAGVYSGNNQQMQQTNFQSFGGGPIFQNPVQKAQYIMQAMTNPAAFVKQHFPDIPDDIANDSNKVLQYLQRTRGISDQQIQQIANQIPRRY